VAAIVSNSADHWPTEDLKVFVDWFLLTPANLVAYLILFPIAFTPLFAAAAAWAYALKFLEAMPAIKARPSLTYIIAGLITVYVFLVTGAALGRLSHVAYVVFERDTDD
jgi:hypothetical protein